MDTQTLTLAEFLLARIAEDEAALDANDGQPLGVHFITVASGERWLAECEGKRRIVERHYEVPASDIEWSSCPICRETWPCPDLRNLALPYADHPDYRDEWRP